MNRLLNSALLLAALLLFSCQCQTPADTVSTPSQATPDAQVEDAIPGSPQAILSLSTDPISPSPGQEMTLEVSVQSRRPMVEIVFDLVWDGEVLEYLDSSAGPFMNASGDASFMAIPDPGKGGRLHMVLGSGEAADAQQGDGDLCYVKYRVNAPSGLKTGIMLDGISVRGPERAIAAADPDGMVLQVQ